MATAMLTDRGLRRKITQDEPRPRAPKRKTTARSRQEPNNNIKRPRTADPKADMLTTYQPWVIQTYGDLAKTKTITIKKYARILRTLRGEEVVSADNSKFRFWVKAKGFHVGKPAGYDAKPADAIVGRYSVCDSDLGIPSVNEKLSGSAKDPPLYVPNAPFKNANGEPVYRKVAVVENFFDIIYNVHVELEGKPGKHAGQKRTYRTITETYAFLPREAVTRFLLGCTECQRRPRSPSPASVLPTPSPSPTLPLPPAAAPRAITDINPVTPPIPATEAQPYGIKSDYKDPQIHGSKLDPQNKPDHQTKLEPLRTSTPEPKRRSSNPLDVCNLTSSSPQPPKISTPPKKRQLLEKNEHKVHKLWSPMDVSNQSKPKNGFPDGEIDYSLPITTTYLKYMRSLGCTDEDAMQLEKSIETEAQHNTRTIVDSYCRKTKTC